MTSERERRFPGPRRGQLLFALFFVAGSALLLALIGQQTRWVAKAQLFAQPRFWPAVGLTCMVGLGGLHLYLLPWRRIDRADLQEARKWLGVGEFGLWFMAYVLVVPVLGYLPTTVAFVAALCRRMGYRGLRMQAVGLGFSVAVVLLFKGLLAVKIPGGAVYEFLPGALRGLFIQYL